ncbi:hypothetical protein M0638_21150 [Roseomonas sp. NAR14]|uniref:Uncharacterized protein n=1 Tax=Roseomonas acroporae TaxID=2937791 RepID=A0A9X2BZB4_9PROT|nr:MULTISPECIES: hypothetical protein [Roseomonas]MCG7351875.1 hypothetical protein [Roseomonas mucosa]MCG7356125.1 hypothetical protein [Roseomonas mucosa]MCK8786885.1 hypothetical protein [Roseomonas acroporae]MDT8294183.1 hypothetical protein [Roseomonas mucosa]UFN51820.1 hypothetical protein LPC08_25710 [Roseomonas sp. OT10]
MNAASRSGWAARLVVGLGLALTAVACAPQSAPQASAPTSAELPVQPAGRSTTTPGAAMQRPDSAGMQGMDHSNMPGMNHGNMQGMSGMQGHNMSGMNMQDMMAHCRQMQADASAGRPIPPDMQSMMAHCNMMGGSSQGRSRSR